MLEKLKEIIYEYTGDSTLDVNENTILIADLGLSSFDLVNLATSVEDEFDIEIPDRAIKDFKTIGDVLSIVKEQ